ncbi:spermidine resistance protein, variant 3 [Bonamia ostreae]
MILKTCGTTPLLICIPLILKTFSLNKSLLVYVIYSHSSFLFPQNQPFPHRFKQFAKINCPENQNFLLETLNFPKLLYKNLRNFESERKFLERFFSGKIFVTDTKQEPIFYLYFAQIRPYFPKNEQTVEMVMFNLSKNLAYFYKNNLLFKSESFLLNKIYFWLKNNFT